jgi:hypothetical protein
MDINTIFDKPIDRHIEGVIKADDDTGLRLEVEEYVLTKEIAGRLDEFLEAYNNYQGANGVWISGFFGSGKSHLLKMLAMLLENRSIDGTSVLEMFLPKIKDNELLKGDLKNAVSIPSKSILFNIDQKADVISKTQIDALLAVFMKVFDEMCGYYGKQGHVAKFERDLDERGLYDRFKAAYRKIASLEWETGREQALLESQNIAAAYAEANGGSKGAADGILDKYRSEYKVSIEDFAEIVHDYIKRQGPKFRLNFFVDEVGQYIADNVKLMTNLQTVAESLATKCKGQAWIIVTAQEDLNSITGEMIKQGNDFSKIQDRFVNRMKLTSADVSEVIRTRLLTKNGTGEEKLSVIYEKQVNNFRTLFDFTDSSQTYSNFKGEDDFCSHYPFIPYQFVLFQKSIQNLSQHNAFEGKHSSVGERSMLAVFQQVVVQISNNDLAHLATFDFMFEGIRTALKSQVQGAILTAESHLDNPFAVRLLKALFLVKYVKEFKATLRNICVLMIDGFDLEIPKLRRQVEEALNLLEQQTYIQRNGDLYEYLTNEEKDIEEEIKNTEADATEVANELSKIVFDHVIKNKKIRHDESDQDYSFTRKLDDRLSGREYELSINVITSFHENHGAADILKAHSMGKAELLVVLPPDDLLMRDIVMYKRTEKYIQQNISVTQQESIKRILNDKASQNEERYRILRDLAGKLLGDGKLIINGEELDVSEKDPQTRIGRGFNEVVRRTYPNLKMLKGVKYTEDNIKKFLSQAGQISISEEDTGLPEAEQEMLFAISRSKKSGTRATLKSLLAEFEKRPYGWYFAAILCILAKLCARGKIDVHVDSNILENKEIESVMLNTKVHGNVILEPQEEITPSQIRLLKDFYQNFFDNPPRSNEAKALGSETAGMLKDMLDSLSNLAGQKDQYSFLKALETPVEKIRECIGKPYAFYFSELNNFEKELLDFKEDIIDPVRRFMSGTAKSIYDEARQFVQLHKSNFTYIDGDEDEQIDTILKDPECYKGNRIQQLKTNLDSLKANVNSVLKTEKESAIKTVDTLKDKMVVMGDYSKLNSEQQTDLLQSFETFNREISNETLIAVIRERQRHFEDKIYPQRLSNMSTWANPKDKKAYPQPGGGTGEVDEEEIEYISLKSIAVSYRKSTLENEDDVVDYLSVLKSALMQEIDNKKRIQI